MSRIQKRESTISDVYALSARLRVEDATEITCLGLDVRVSMRATFRGSILRRTYFVDGEIAAMTGMGGALLSDEGRPWLMTTYAVERVPVAFVKCAREAIDEMLLHRSFLYNYVMASYTRACRLLEVLGFVLDPAIGLGPNHVPFRRFWMER